jgi:iron complex outermembrane recepter protein
MPSSRVSAGLAAALSLQFCVAQMAAAQGTPTPAGQPAGTPAEQPAADAAQAAEPAPGEAAPSSGKRKSGEEEIVVTGSRIRRKDLTTPAPITVISKDQVQASGKVSIGDFLQMLPEQGNATNTAINNGGSGATRVSLRGLGVARTLVLLNGRRFVPGGFGNNGTDASVDLNAIPTAVIERVEVLKDGASAVYGSDAIGGVVNLITRKRLNGAEVSGYAGTSTHGDGQTYDINFTGGTSGERGSVLFSGGYYTQKTVWGGDRDFARIPLSYDAVGSLTTTGKPGPYSQGSTTVPAGTIVLPTGQAGKPLPNPNNDPRIAFYNQLVTQNPTATTFIRDPSATNSICLGGSTTDCWRPFKNASLPPDGDGYNFMPDNYLVTPQQRISLYSIGDIRLGEGARAYFEGSYVNRQSAINLAAEPYLSDTENMTISKDNFYNPFGRDFTQGPGTPAATAGAVRKRLLEFGTRYTKSDIDTFRVVAGLDGSLPEAAGPLKGWVWDVSLNYGRTTSTIVKQGNINKVTMQQALGPSDRDGHCLDATGTIIAGCVPLNLFGGPNSITPDQIANLQYTGTLRGTNQLTAAQLNASGELFKLFAERPIGLALGYEYRIVSGENIPDPITVAGQTTGNKADITRGHYYVNEGYGELSIPVIGGVPFVEDLEASAAIRVFDYNTFGSDFTYKFGGRWRVIRDFTFRGTYSTGFRAPSVAELYQGQSDAFPNVQDPCRGLGVAGGGPPPATCGDAANNGDAQTQLRSRVGGNTDLKPETAKIFTAGIVIEPRFIRNFTVTADYFNITIDQTLAPIGASTILNACYFGDPASASRYCDLIQRDPTTHKIVNIINLTTNAGKDETDGIDLAVRYDIPSEYGRWGLLFDGTWLHQYNRTLADGTVVRARGTFDLATTGGVYPAFKFNAGLRWALDGFGAGVNTRFLGSFKECGTSSGNFAGSGQCYVNDTYQRHVDAYNTWDVYASYAFNTTVGKTTITGGVNNIFNKDPAVIYNGFTAASDPTAYADGFMGRFFYARVGHAF